jgi:hypothetical protein
MSKKLATGLAALFIFAAHAATAEQTQQLPIKSTTNFIYFDTGSHALTPNEQDRIRDVAAMIQSTPTFVATIIGKTDSIGSADFNEHLSQQRATAVFEALVHANKVPENRVQMRWTGERLPFTAAADEKAESQNRLVAIVVSDAAAAQPTPTLADERAAAAERVKKLLSIDWEALTDFRIAGLKAALRLTPDQEKYWPAVEQAIRERATERHQRLENLAARLGASGEPNPIAIMRARADSLSQRAASLKKLADAWQPLYESLDSDQKQRLRFLAARVVRELKEAVENRRMEREDEDDD